MTAIETTPVSADVVGCTVDGPELKKALARIKSAVGRRGHLPVMRFVRAEVGAGTLTLTATNRDLTLTTSIDAAGVAPGVGLVDFTTLSKTAAKAKGSMRISFAGDEVTVDTDGLKIRTPSHDLDEYPKLPTETSPATVTLDLGVVSEVVGAVSGDDNRPILTGVFFSGDGDVVGTDSYRLHLVSGVPMFRALVPSSVFKALPNTGTATVSMTSDGRNIRFEVDDLVAWVRALDEGEFPNYRQLIPAESTTRPRVRIDGPAAVEALKKIIGSGIITEPTVPVRVETDSDDGIRLRVATHDGGAVEATVAGVSDTGKLAFVPAFSPPFLRDALDGIDEVVLEVSDALKPAVIRHQVDGLDAVRLLMPVRVS